MDKPYSRAEEDFFITALKEEARDILWKVGSNAEPKGLIDGILEELQALAPRDEADEDRSDEEIWRQIRERLLKAAYATRPHCIRCGTCCTQGSPTLTKEDLSLFTKDILKPEHVLTIREGEPVYDSRTEQTKAAEQEMIKIREATDKRTCVFYEEGGKKCTIYESRPQQCRRQECWNPEASSEAEDIPLTREDLLKPAEELWNVIRRHEEQCSHDQLSRSMAKLGATSGLTIEQLLEILRFDQHVREFIAEKLNLRPETMDFFFGRPLREIIAVYGLKVEDQPDGSFLVTPIEEDAGK